MSAKTQRIPAILRSCACALFLTASALGQAETPAEDAVPEGLSERDWSGIRAAYQAGRHAAYSVEGGYQARNPGQRWRTHFDGRGFLTRPDAAGWTWGLELERYGFAGKELRVTTPAQVRAEGGRVAYEWDATLEEWYQNDTRGLEHGYTVHRRPERDAQNPANPLTFTLAVRGNLRAEVMNDGRGVRFLDKGGAVTLTYTGLLVLDADGRELEASFKAFGEEGHSLLLSVDERGSRYPLVIDPIAQQAYLKASNTDSSDKFGGSLAISGDTVVVGARLEDSNATGVNGDDSDNSADWSGAAYVFVHTGSSWSQQAYLKASNTETNDYFGFSVAVSGDTVVVGAIGEASNATGVNGDQSDNSMYEAGAAYVFVRNGTSWSQEAYLKASNTDANDEFGWDLAISGDTAIVGAYRESSNATGVNGNQGDNSAPDAGAAYVFARSGTSWSQEAYLKASNTDTYDQFALSVAISGETVVVGADFEDSNATVVNGDDSDNSVNRSGAAYVFVRSAGSWSQQAYLKASNATVADWFGFSVAVLGDRVAVGAIMEGYYEGAAYVFARSGTSWSQEAYLRASNPDQHDWFGWSVALSGDALVVGAIQESSNATGVNGNQFNNSAWQSGAAYAFGIDLGTPYCTAGLNSTGDRATISASGSVSVAANDFLLRAGPVPDQVGVFFYGPQQTSVPFGNGTLCVAGQIGRLGAVNVVGNVMTYPLDYMSPPSASTQIAPGSTWNFQAWFRDNAAGGAAFDFSNGLSVTFGL